MTTIQIINYQDTKKVLAEKLRQVTADSATINTKYQNYLKANPYKKEKKDLNEKKKRLINLSIMLLEVDPLKFDQRMITKFSREMVK